MTRPSFDDLLAAVLLYLEAWKRTGDAEEVTEAWQLLQEQAQGAQSFTSHERERIFRDAAIRVAVERGEEYAEIGARFGLHHSTISRIALAAGYRRRAAQGETPWP
jgi:hypothetical protein